MMEGRNIVYFDYVVYVRRIAWNLIMFEGIPDRQTDRDHLPTSGAAKPIIYNKFIRLIN